MTAIERKKFFSFFRYVVYAILFLTLYVLQNTPSLFSVYDNPNLRGICKRGHISRLGAACFAVLAGDILPCKPVTVLWGTPYYFISELISGCISQKSVTPTQSDDD